VKELYPTVINVTYQNYSQQELVGSKAGLQEIKVQRKARELLPAGDIDAKDYRTIKLNQTYKKASIESK